MRYIFRDNEPLAQLVLRIILEKPDLIVERVETKRDAKRLAGARSVSFDVYATDSENRKYDIEIQRADKGAGKHRARYHSSAMDVEGLTLFDDGEYILYMNGAYRDDTDFGMLKWSPCQDHVRKFYRERFSTQF